MAGRRRAWSLALLLLASGPAARAQLVVPEGSAFRNGSTLLLADTGGAAAVLAAFQEALVLGDGPEAARQLAVLRRRPGDDLLRFGVRTHVPALERAAHLLMDWDGPQLRDAVLAQERARVEAARERRDLDTLLDHATRGTSLPTSREAAWIAARLLFEQGRAWEAGALAARLHDQAGADALRAAAGMRDPTGAPPPAQGPWTFAYSFPARIDTHPLAPLPLVIDGRDGELLLVDTAGVMSVDAVGARKACPDFDWGLEVLGSQRLTLGLPAPMRMACARAGNRLVLPLNPTAEGLLRWRGAPALRQPGLVAIDIGRAPDDAPRPAWFARPAVDPDASVALGPATVAGDRVFCLAYRVGLQTEVSLRAFALADGAPLFETPLARGAPVPRYASRRASVDVADLDKRAGASTVAVVAGVVYACTGVGAVAAVDGVTGRVRHTFRYDRLFALDSDTYDPAFLFDTGGWDHEPVRVFGERVVVAPADSRFLYMLALEPGPAGQLILEDPIERLDRRAVVDLLPDPGGSDAPAVLATRRRDGRDGLVLLSPMGHTLASSERLSDDEPMTGAPARVGGVVAVPSRTGVRLWDVTDLARPPALLPCPSHLPPPRAVYPLAIGLAVVHPDPGKLMGLAYWKLLR